MTVACGLRIALHEGHRFLIPLGGAVAGLGVAAMHYTGMAALEVPARISWSLDLVAVSVVLGCALAGLALWVAVRSEDMRTTAVASILFTIAIVSHHFTAMGAITLIPDPTRGAGGVSISPAMLSFLTALASVAILLISLVAALLDRRTKRQLLRQKVLLDTALENMSQGLCMFDADGRIMLANERYSALMGLDTGPHDGESLVSILERQKAAGQWMGDAAQYVGDLVREIKAGHTVTRVITRLNRAIRVVHQPMTRGGWVATFEDITEWEAAQQQIFHMARHDALTNLPNRALFREQLERALHLAKRDDQLAVFCLDLDHFKEVNDSLGHPVGDALLKAVAHRLRQTYPEMIPSGGSAATNSPSCSRSSRRVRQFALAERLIKAIGAPYEIEGHQIVIGISIGIALAPADGTDATQLLKNADLALYRAKTDGRNITASSRTSMDASARLRRALEIDLRKRDAARGIRGPLPKHHQRRLTARPAVSRRWCAGAIRSAA